MTYTRREGKKCDSLVQVEQSILCVCLCPNNNSVELNHLSPRNWQAVSPWSCLCQIQKPRSYVRSSRSDTEWKYYQSDQSDLEWRLSSW